MKMENYQVFNITVLTTSMKVGDLRYELINKSHVSELNIHLVVELCSRLSQFFNNGGRYLERLFV